MTDEPGGRMYRSMSKSNACFTNGPGAAWARVGDGPTSTAAARTNTINGIKRHIAVSSE
jgi:hypothetical protein